MSKVERPTSVHPLFDKVVAGGYCIGCGACAIGGTGIAIRENAEGFLQATGAEAGKVSDESASLMQLCPMSGEGEDETVLATPLFEAQCTWDERVGYHESVFVGHVRDRDDRKRGSSGGLTTWLLRRMLERNIVDHVVHILPVEAPAGSGAPLFEFGISSNAKALERGRKSTYYPVEMSAALEHILATPGRYAVTTVPCFAKAIRLRNQHDPVLKSRVVAIIGTVCGHLKSRYFAEYLAWSRGVTPDALTAIDFRTKLAGYAASDYGFTPNHDRRRTALTKDLFAANWEVSFFRYDACEFCDDVFAETADIVFGDAWISPYQDDWLGNNIVVSRRPDLSRLLREGREAGVLTLAAATVEQAAQSQSGGLRHRREGLAVRLAAKDRQGKWRPRKRVQAGDTHLDSERATLYLRRSQLSRQSVEAFRRAKRAGSLALFTLLISGPVFLYYRKRYGIKRAVRESAPMKALRRLVRRVYR